MEKILISACLLGDRVRYDGKSKAVCHDLIDKWQQEGRLVKFCPEVFGGLPVPRPAAELDAGRKVKTAEGTDVTTAFVKGAKGALELCREQNIHFAVTKENSPSCGVTHIYDGSHSGHLIAGQGLTCQLLRTHQVEVFSEDQLEVLAEKLK